MFYVCGILHEGKLYAVDDKTYTTQTGARKRCDKLNVRTLGLSVPYANSKWSVFVADTFKPVQ